MLKVLLLLQLFAIYVSAYSYLPQHYASYRLVPNQGLSKCNMFSSNDPSSEPRAAVSDENMKSEVDITTNSINKNKDSALPLPAGFDLSSISTILIYGYLAYLFFDTLLIIVTGKSFDFSQYGK